MHFLFLLASEIHSTLFPDAYVSVQRFIERDSMPNAAYHVEGSPPSLSPAGNAEISQSPLALVLLVNRHVAVPTLAWREGGEKDLGADQNDGKGGWF